jgi:hypothetical protein
MAANNAIGIEIPAIFIVTYRAWQTTLGPITFSHNVIIGQCHTLFSSAALLGKFLICWKVRIATGGFVCRGARRVVIGRTTLRDRAWVVDHDDGALGEERDHARELVDHFESVRLTHRSFV